MSTRKATIAFPDGTTHTRRTHLPYTHAVARRFNPEKRWREAVKYWDDHMEREKAAGRTLDAAACRHITKVQLNLGANLGRTSAWEAVSFHRCERLAINRARNEARYKRADVAVLPVVLS